MYCADMCSNLVCQDDMLEVQTLQFTFMIQLYVPLFPLQVSCDYQLWKRYLSTYLATCTSSFHNKCKDMRLNHFNSVAEQKKGISTLHHTALKQLSLTNHPNQEITQYSQTSNKKSRKVYMKSLRNYRNLEYVLQHRYHIRQLILILRRGIHLDNTRILPLKKEKQIWCVVSRLTFILTFVKFGILHTF